MMVLATINHCEVHKTLSVSPVSFPGASTVSSSSAARDYWLSFLCLPFCASRVRRVFTAVALLAATRFRSFTGLVVGVGAVTFCVAPYFALTLAKAALLLLHTKTWIINCSTILQQRLAVVRHSAAFATARNYPHFKGRLLCDGFDMCLFILISTRIPCWNSVLIKLYNLWFDEITVNLVFLASKGIQDSYFLLFELR